MFVVPEKKLLGRNMVIEISLFYGTCHIPEVTKQ